MELKLTREETEGALLAWVDAHFPGRFNTVELSSRYSSDVATFSYVAPEPAKQEESA